MYILDIHLFPFFMVLVSLMGVFYFRKQVMMSLIMLEYFVLGLFVISVLFFSQYCSMVSLSFYILVLGCCEASIGLSLLVIVMRFKGSDMLSLISSFKY